MVDAEYEELNEGDDALGLGEPDSLPWLESDEEDEGAGGFDTSQFILVGLGMVALLVVIWAGVWYVTNRASSNQVVADGSVIPAPDGPIKSRPDDPGGKTFDGTGNVAPVVGEGGSRPGVVAETPLPGGTPGKPMAGQPAAKASSAPSAAPTKPIPAASPAAGQAPATGGVGVQLAAYGTRARAEQGWSDAQRRTEALKGVKYRVVEGKVDIGTVYRLQAVVGTRAEADSLCRALKADGVDCQVK